MLHLFFPTAGVDPMCLTATWIVAQATTAGVEKCQLEAVPAFKLVAKLSKGLLHPFVPARIAMAAILENLKYDPSFGNVQTLAEDQSSEGKFGIPRFAGQPSVLQEYAFRVRSKMHREPKMDESEVKKLGPLGLRSVEGLRGDALKLAQQMKMEDLAKPGAPEQLLKMFAENLKPRKAQEARELFAAGSKDGGILAPQQNVPMSSYVLSWKGKGFGKPWSNAPGKGWADELICAFLERKKLWKADELICAVLERKRLGKDKATDARGSHEVIPPPQQSALTHASAPALPQPAGDGCPHSRTTKKGSNAHMSRWWHVWTATRWFRVSRPMRLPLGQEPQFRSQMLWERMPATQIADVSMWHGEAVMATDGRRLAWIVERCWLDHRLQHQQRRSQDLRHNNHLHLYLNNKACSTWPRCRRFWDQVWWWHRWRQQRGPCSVWRWMKSIVSWMLLLRPFLHCLPLRHHTAAFQRLLLDLHSKWEPQKSRGSMSRLPEDCLNLVLPMGMQGCQHLVHLEIILTTGKYKNKPFWYAYTDDDYVDWCLNNVSQQSCRGLKKFVEYIRDRNALKRQAFMAANEDEDYGDGRTSVEFDLVAILDLGCNKTCHGSRWFLKYVKAMKEKKKTIHFKFVKGKALLELEERLRWMETATWALDLSSVVEALQLGPRLAPSSRTVMRLCFSALLIRGSWDWCWSLEKARTRSIATIYKNIFTWSPPMDFWEFDFCLPMSPCLARWLKRILKMQAPLQDHLLHHNTRKRSQLTQNLIHHKSFQRQEHCRLDLGIAFWNWKMAITRWWAKDRRGCLNKQPLRWRTKTWAFGQLFALELDLHCRKGAKFSWWKSLLEQLFWVMWWQWQDALLQLLSTWLLMDPTYLILSSGRSWRQRLMPRTPMPSPLHLFVDLGDHGVGWTWARVRRRPSSS